MNSVGAMPKSGSSAPPASTILVVEDEVLVRLAIADYLRDCGYQVFEAGDAAEAQIVLNAGTSVDVVFSDVQLPGGMDGFGLARWIRQHHPGVQVLLTSGRVNEAHRAAELCDDGPLLAKPYGEDEVLRRIELLLQRAARAQP
jgi:DNA-binding response OmpR family regulator